MNWWGSLDKASNISKIALSALKNAQQKIDEVLDISDEPIGSKNCQANNEEKPCFTDVNEKDTFTINSACSDSNTLLSVSIAHDNKEPLLDAICTFDSNPAENAQEKTDQDFQIPSDVADVSNYFNKLDSENLLLNTVPDIQSSHDFQPSRNAFADNENKYGEECGIKHSPVFDNSTSVSKVPTQSLFIEHKSGFDHNSENFEPANKSLLTIHRSVSDEHLKFFRDSSCAAILSSVNQISCGDEDMETNTTGSDIEVISCCTSTNGESHGINSQSNPNQTIKGVGIFPCQSSLVHQSVPVRDLSGLTVSTKFYSHRGHRRAVSFSQELNSDSLLPMDNDFSFAYHSLIKKFSEVTQLLSVREAKIVQLSHENNLLIDSNSALQDQLKSTLAAEKSGSTDVYHLTSEFTQRLQDAEFRLQQVCRERDQLKRSLSVVRKNVTNRAVDDDKPFKINKDLKRLTELEQLVNEKNEQIEGLLQEGHKLAADQLKANNVIKKLRSEIKELKLNEVSQMKQIEHITNELQKIQNILSSKEELLSSYMVKLAQQTKTIENQEEQLQISRLKLEKAEKEILDQSEQLKKLESENLELEEKLNQAQTNVEAETSSMQELQSLRHECKLLREELSHSIKQLNASKIHHDQQSEKWRIELSYYQNLLSETQSKIESMGEMTTNAAQPIMRQLEILQNNLSTSTIEWERKEQQLNERLIEYQRIAADAELSAQTWRTRLEEEEFKVLKLEQQISLMKSEQFDLEKSLQSERDQSQSNLISEQKINQDLEQSRTELLQSHEKINNLEISLRSEKKIRTACELEISELSKQISDLKQQLEKKSQMDQNKYVSSWTSNSFITTTSDVSTEPSQHPSFTVGNNSFPSSPIFGSQAAFEYLQSCIHLREGECSQLKRDVERLAAAQEALLTEVAKESARAEKYARLAGLTYTGRTSESKSHSNLLDESEELQQRYEALLILYGKLTEENEELKLDLADVKEMYKAQINMLLKDKSTV